MYTFQEIVLILNEYWNSKDCILLQPYDIPMGAGTSHIATFLKAIGPNYWKAAYIQPSRRPKDGRYGNNPNRLQHYFQYQVVLKPAPYNILDLYINSLRVLGINIIENDIRFVEDDWENPTMGAWGLGWEVWLNSIEITQFTYFQQVGSLDCNPITGEITYGLERLAMHLQRVDNIYDIIWQIDKKNKFQISYKTLYKQNELEQSLYNFEYVSSSMLFRHFKDYELEAKRLIKIPLIIPAYESVLKSSYIFNMLEAKGLISTTERSSYISKIRNLSRSIAKIYYNSIVNTYIT